MNVGSAARGGETDPAESPPKAFPGRLRDAGVPARSDGSGLRPARLGRGARRRALKRAQFARSWLAALPVRASTARWEALAIETLPAIAAASLLAAASLSCALLLGFRHEGGSVAALRVWAYLSTGIAAGVIGSYLMPQPKAVDLPPGSRYVPRARRRRGAAIRPSFSSLGQWPIRQMFARAQPKILARATIPVMLTMPLGTMADSALVVREHITLRALLLPACAVIAAGGALETLLLLVFDVSVRIAVEVGMATSAMGCIICVSVLSAAAARCSWPRILWISSSTMRIEPRS